MAEARISLDQALQTVSTADSYAEPGDVECDMCTGKKHKAFKSCLMCMVSVCKTHLKLHYEIHGWKQQELIEAAKNLQDKICSEHDKVLEICCLTDESFICDLCLMDKHKGHKTISIASLMGEKQSDVKDEEMKPEQRIQEKQKKVQELEQAVNTIKLSAQTAVEDSERIFTELISSMEKKRSEVTEQIRAQEKAQLSRAERLQEQLEQEIADLQRRLTELEQQRKSLESGRHSPPHGRPDFQSEESSESGRQSPPHGRPNFQSEEVYEDTSSITVNQQPVFDGVENFLSGVKNRFMTFFQEAFIKIPEHVENVQIVLSEPKSRVNFLQYFCDLTLDPNTVNYNLILSEKNRAVTCSAIEQTYSDHPERFDFRQVLSKESVCGRCYWEVECSGDGVFISVSYKGISRKGGDNKCLLGRNKLSWSLQCSPSAFSFYHNDIKTDLGAPSSSRIGVYVDHSAGILSFYSVSDTMKLLHRVHTTFTQPLYAGFRLYWNEGCEKAPNVRLCALKEE